jgi:hypothetical protein
VTCGDVFLDDRSRVAQMLGEKITELQQPTAKPADPDLW